MVQFDSIQFEDFEPVYSIQIQTFGRADIFETYEKHSAGHDSSS